MIYERSKPYINKCFPPDQAGFRPNRSTADITFAHKFLKLLLGITQHSNI